MTATVTDEFRATVNPWGGGMDWLEIRLPQLVPFRPRVQEAIATWRNGERSEFVQSQHYAAVVDLRKFDIADAFLHLGNKHDKGHSHKIQMVGTGQYSFGQHMADVEAIVDSDPLKLEPMRTDLTVDVENVPMSWVLNHARVAGKRFGAQLGKVNEVETAVAVDKRDEYMLMGTRELQTAYAGKQPNCFRVYNKTAERMKAYHSFVRGWTPREPTWKDWCERDRASMAATGEEYESMRAAFDQVHAAWEQMAEERGPRPSFKEFCGMETTQVLTRFERQIGAQQVKKLYAVDSMGKRPLFTTLRDLRDNVTDFNPFESMTFSQPGRPEPPLPNGENYSLMVYMAGMYFRDRILREGRQAAQSWATPLANGNIKKVLDRLAPFQPAEDDGAIKITEAELYERYRHAMQQQLAA